jgi:hypothetical protein
MAFVYEKLTEQNWEKHPELDIKGLDGWYIDKERDVSIWVVNQAQHIMEVAEGNYNRLARLRIGKNLITFVLTNGQGSSHFSEKPYYIVWDTLVSYSPQDLYGVDYDNVLNLLKEALTAWGGGYLRNTKYHPNFIVQFNF